MMIVTVGEDAGIFVFVGDGGTGAVGVRVARGGSSVGLAVALRRATAVASGIGVSEWGGEVSGALASFPGQ
jgi:hypothetical protein